MLNNTSFYILSAILILLSVTVVILSNIRTAIVAASCFFFTTGILFFLSGAYITGIFQIVILAIFTGIIYFINFKNEPYERKNIFKKPKFWVGLAYTVILFFITGFFIYYCNNSSFEKNAIIPNTIKAFLLTFLLSLITNHLQIKIHQFQLS